jgi:phage shock protein PspC (stress-responsive transcriptional regulator)
VSTFGRKFYRDKFNGKLLGVCAGMEDYFGVNALWFRLGVIVLFFMGVVFIVPIYFLTAMLSDKKPPQHYTDSLRNTFSEPHIAPPASDLTGPATRKGIDL